MKKYIKEFFGLTFLLPLILPFSYKLWFSGLGVPFNLLEVIIVLSVVGLGIFEFFGPEYETSDKSRPIRTVVKVALIGLFVGLAFSTFISPEKKRAIGMLKSWFFFPVIYGYMIYSYVYTKSRLKDVLYSFVLGGVLLSLVSLIGAIFTDSFYQSGRLKSFFESPNYLSLYLSPIITFSSVFSFFSQNGKVKKFYIFSTILMLATIILTQSRTGIFVSIVGIFFSGGAWITYNIREMKTQSLKIGILSLVLVLGIGIGSIVKIYSQNRIDSSDSIRIEIWKEAIQMAKENPTKGIGLGNFQNDFEERTKDRVNFSEYIIPNALFPHNLYLTLLLEGGLVSLISFGVISFSVLVILLKTLSEVKHKIKHIQRYELEDSEEKTNLEFFNTTIIAVLGAFLSILVYGLIDTPIWKNDLSLAFAFLVSVSLVLDGLWVRFSD